MAIALGAEPLPEAVDYVVTAGKTEASGAFAVDAAGLWAGTVPLQPGDNEVALGVGQKRQRGQRRVGRVGHRFEQLFETANGTFDGRPIEEGSLIVEGRRDSFGEAQ